MVVTILTKENVKCGLTLKQPLVEFLVGDIWVTQKTVGTTAERKGQHQGSESNGTYLSSKVVSDALRR